MRFYLLLCLSLLLTACERSSTYYDGRKFTSEWPPASLTSEIRAGSSTGGVSILAGEAGSIPFSTPTPGPDDISVTFAQVNRVVGQEAAVVTVNDAGTFFVFYRPNNELGYVNPENGDLLNCGFYPGTNTIPVLDCVVNGNVSQLVGMNYSNGQPIATNGGNTVFHRSGTTMRAGGNWSYALGSPLKSGSTYTWSNGTQMKSSTTFFHPNGIFLRNFLYYSDGFLYSDPPDLYFPNGQILRIGNDYFYETGDYLRLSGTTYYPTGSLMIDSNGVAYDQLGSPASYPFDHYESFTDSEVNFHATNAFSEIVTAIGTISSGSGAAFLNYSKLAYTPPDPINVQLSEVTPTTATFTFESGGGATTDFLGKYELGNTPPSDCTGGTVLTSSPFVVEELPHGQEIAVRICARSSEGKVSGGAQQFATTECPRIPGDYNGDGTVDAADYTVWRNNYGSTVPPGTGADSDNDGDVDGHDFLNWQRNVGNSYTPPVYGINPDGSGDGTVDTADYVVWRMMFGATSSCYGGGNDPEN